MIEHDNLKDEIISVFDMIGRAATLEEGKKPVVPSEKALYHYLESYAYDDIDVGKSIEEEQTQIVNYAISKRIKNDYQLKHSIISGHYKVVSCRDKVSREISHNDAIWLHFSIVPTNLVEVATMIIDFILENKMSYTLKIPATIGPNILVLGLYSKEDAKALIDYCKRPKIIEHLLYNNPLMPHENYVGIAKEINGRSYTHHVAHHLHNYFKHITDEFYKTGTLNDAWAKLEDFHQYVYDDFQNHAKDVTVFERYLNYQISLALWCAKESKSYLDMVDHLKPITFDLDKFHKYRSTYKNNTFEYIAEDETMINRENSYLLWLELQAYNCIERMNAEQKKAVPIQDQEVSQIMTGRLSRTADTVLNKADVYSAISFSDVLISELYPSFVAYHAYLRKMASMEEARYIEDEVRKRIIQTSKGSDASKNNYTVEYRSIISSTYPLHIDGCLIGIEFLNFNDNYGNIHILKDGILKSHTCLFFDEMDRNKLLDINSIDGRLYRATLARALVKIDSIPYEIITRSNKTGNLILLNQVMPHIEYPVSQELLEEFGLNKNDQDY